MAFLEMSQYDALEVAVSAFNRFPFYRWFFKELKAKDPHSWKYRDLPTLSKNHIFEYESIVKENYDSPLKLSNPITLTTSGTTGRPLRVEWSVKDAIENVAKQFFVELDKMVGRAAFVLVEPRAPLLKACFMYGKEVDGRTVYFIPNEKIYDTNYITNVLSRKEVNVILDLPGVWAAQLIKQGVALHDLGIRTVWTMTPDPESERILNESGLFMLRTFMTNEAMMIGHTCRFCKDYHISRDRYVHILRKEKIQELGEGDLIFTNDRPDGGFPFVKYANGDIIKIISSNCRCGFVGRSFRFITRKHQVKVPDISGVFVNVERIHDELSKILNARVIVVHVAASINKRVISMIVTFIGKEKIQKPTLQKDLSRMVLQIGTGGVDESFLFAVPVILLPFDSIPYTESESPHKLRTYIEGVGGVFPNEYRQLLDIIEDLTGVRIDRKAFM